MKNNILFGFILGVLFGGSFLVVPNSALAMDCFNDPVYERDLGGVISTGARVRSVACMEGSDVLTTLAVGTRIDVIGETDGWYKIRSGEYVGWVGQWLIDIGGDGEEIAEAGVEYVGSEQGGEDDGDSDDVENVVTSVVSGDLVSRLRGYILLQVERNGEAWYVSPENGKRYYMKDGDVAYEMLRYFGLGITDSDLALLQAGDFGLVERLKGRIVLQVEHLGEAYYVHPKDGSVHYMKDGDAAYGIMRELSLGITDSDLEGVVSDEFVAVKYENSESATGDEGDNVDENDESDGDESHEDDAYDGSGSYVIEYDGIDISEVNTLWLDEINALRANKGLRLLVVDDRWIETASEYAQYMGDNEVMDHSRADGKSMHEWIDTKGLDFTERYSDGGWNTNYFTENIAWGYMSELNLDELTDVMADTLDFYLAEEGYNGAHYRTIYHTDWNSVGTGVYILNSGSGYKAYLVFHYGSLEL